MRRRSAWLAALGVGIAVAGFGLGAAPALAGPGAVTRTPGVPEALSPQASAEYRLKAAFLYNFAKFVRWPESAFVEGSEIVVAVLGEDPFGTALEDTLDGKSVDGRRFRVVRFRSVDEASRSHILFVSASEQDRMEEIIEAIDGLPVLTVSEVPGFARSGGVVNFFVEDDKIRFEINYEKSQRMGLEISSRLLSLARVVDDGNRS